MYRPHGKWEACNGLWTGMFRAAFHALASGLHIPDSVLTSDSQCYALVTPGLC